MKIIFDVRNVGLGNNGGSSTLIKSANVLSELGHTIYFVDSMKNQHTWEQLNDSVEHLINVLPEADFIIATGYKSINPTVNAPASCGIKCHWIRGYETWVMPENMIIDYVFKAPTIKFVNGIGLQKKLNSYNIDSYIVRPGYDLNIYYPKTRMVVDHIVLGGLYNQKHFKIKRVAWVYNTYQHLKNKGYNVKLHMFGVDKTLNFKPDYYISNPNEIEKNVFYNNIDIWLSPSMQEGLHIPPAEAMMTGVPVVSTNAELAGTEDYLIHEYNGLVSENNFKSFCESVELLVSNKGMLEMLAIHTRDTITELGDRKYNMKNFIDLLQKLKE